MSLGKITDFAKDHKLLILLVVSLFLYFFRIWTSHIYFSDELIIEDASYAMAHGSSLIVPTLDGAPLLTKPPLLYWQIAPLYYFFPPVHWLVRLWMPIYAIGLVFATYKLASLWYGTRVGFLSALLLATSTPLIYQTKAATYDLPNAFFTVLTVYFYNRAKGTFFSSKQSAFIGNQNRRLLVLAAISFALGLLDRSFLALAPLLIILADHLFSNKKIPILQILAFITPGFLLLIFWSYLAYQRVPFEFLRDILSFPLQWHLFGFNPGDVKDPPFLITVFFWFLPALFLFSYRYYYVFKPKSDSFIQLLSWLLGFGLTSVLASDTHIWYFFPIFPALAITSGCILAEILRQKGSNSFAHFWMVIFILVSPVGLIIFDVPQAETITAVRYVTQNSTNSEPVYFWKYLMIPTTKFFPGRPVNVINEADLNGAVYNQHMKFLMVRNEDLGDISSRLPKDTKYLRADQYTLLQFFGLEQNSVSWRDWYKQAL